MSFELWISLGVALFLAWALFARWCIHRMLGHRNYRGTWYSARQYDSLMQMLKQDQDTGRRILTRYEVEAIREHFYGGELRPMISDKHAVGLFD